MNRSTRERPLYELEDATLSAQTSMLALGCELDRVVRLATQVARQRDSFEAKLIEAQAEIRRLKKRLARRTVVDVAVNSV